MILRFSLTLCTLALATCANDRAPLPALGCDTFAAARSIPSLQSAIGSTETATDSVPLGATEGDMVPATVFFPGVPDRRIEVVWRAGDPSRGPRYVRLRASATEWRTKDSISIGTSLQRLEELNAGGFQLAGFAFDGAGTVTSWGSGRLRSPSGASCQVMVRLDSLPTLDSRQRAVFKQVSGDRTFSSGHPAMHALNPRVSELLLIFP